MNKSRIPTAVRLLLLAVVAACSTACHFHGFHGFRGHHHHSCAPIRICR